MVSRVLAAETAVRWLPRLAVANLVANVVIVVTGGAVRLTASGLGCPTWPRCTDESYVVHGELGIHGVIEFGNRTLTVVLVLVALACLLAARQAGDRRAFQLSAVVASIVPAQIVIGGITVLTDLNPWIVSFHLLASMAIIGVCVLLLDHLLGPTRAEASGQSHRVAWLVFGIGWVVLYLGTIVTGSGPHSGDLDSRRTGLDPHVMSHVHASAVYALVAFTVGLLAVARRRGDRPVVQAAAVLLVVEVTQGAIGFAQYFLDLPEVLVALHMLGAALTSAALATVVLSTRRHD